MIRWFKNWVIARAIKAIAKDLDKNKDGVVSPKEVNKVITDTVSPMVKAICKELNAKSGK